jgi:hypothetical protein
MPPLQPQPLLMSPPNGQPQFPQLLGPPPFMGGPAQFLPLGFPGGLYQMPGFPPSFLTLPRLPVTGPPPAGFYLSAQPPQHQLFPPPCSLPEGFALLPGYGPVGLSQPASPVSSLASTPPSSASLKRKASIPPSPEQSPQGPYIGQHSQGLGGHYADSYWYSKRQKRN